MRCFHALARHPSFSGSLKPGEVADSHQQEELGLSALDDATDHHEGDTNISDEEEEEGEEVAETQKQQDIESIMTAFSD